MAVGLSHNHLVDLFGILGNISSFLIYVAPLFTFRKIYKAKSTQNFPFIPYLAAMFSSMLTMYYGILKQQHGLYLIINNSFGITIESIYLAVYMLYSPSATRHKVKLTVLLNLGLFGVILLFTLLFTHGVTRQNVVGCLCAIASICIFASPLSILMEVIKTQSVEFLSPWLSSCLFICASTWFTYGLVSRDHFIAIPNVLGLLLSSVQIALFLSFRKNSKDKNTNSSQHKLAINISRQVPSTKEGDEINQGEASKPDVLVPKIPTISISSIDGENEEEIMLVEDDVVVVDDGIVAQVEKAPEE